MTKDGPDFPDRLLVAGRFDGYVARPFGLVTPTFIIEPEHTA